MSIKRLTETIERGGGGEGRERMGRGGEGERGRGGEGERGRGKGRGELE